jgi:hypothetical protein
VATKKWRLGMHFIEEEREAGEPIGQALVVAGIERLRSVLITVGATIYHLSNPTFEVPRNFPSLASKP